MNEKVKYLLILGAFIILGIIGYCCLPSDEIVIQADNQQQEETDYIYVHIEGCVQNPGLFKVQDGTRMYELLELAGGETDDADLTRINLASILTDAQKVIIPAVYIPTEEGEISSGIYQRMVNINTATLDELQTLNGIGPSMAQKILDYRNKNGYFLQIEDIMEVDGIGEGKFNKIKDNITI